MLNLYEMGCWENPLFQTPDYMSAQGHFWGGSKLQTGGESLRHPPWSLYIKYLLGAPGWFNRLSV